MQEGVSFSVTAANSPSAPGRPSLPSARLTVADFLAAKMESEDPSGFTLLEVMVAVAVMGALLLTLIYTLNYHLSIAERQEALTIAYLLAREKMEEMEREAGVTRGEFPSPYSGFRYRTEVKGSPLPGWSEVQVSVTNGREEARLVGLVKQRE